MSNYECLYYYRPVFSTEVCLVRMDNRNNSRTFSYLSISTVLKNNTLELSPLVQARLTLLAPYVVYRWEDDRD